MVLPTYVAPSNNICSLELSDIVWLVPGYLIQTWGIFRISNNCYLINKLKVMRLSYKSIQSKAVLSNLQFNISSV